MTTQPQRHDNRIVLVVGGGRGIGAAVVETFARQGATVVAADAETLGSDVNHYRSKRVGGYAAARELARNLQDKGLGVSAADVDAGDEDSVRALLARVDEDHGRLDVVVNAFGVTHVSKVEDMTLTQFESVVSGNLSGVFLVSKYAIPLLRRSGGGAIVNFSSISGRMGFAKEAHYCAAKFGVIGFTASLAKELATSGIRVNAVCPGIVRSNMWDYLLSEFVRPGETQEECWERMRALIPQGEFQSPQDIADAVLYLASAPRVTGQAISVDGGMAQP
ncbi:SDR family NAD(P)-dependent oxidoreductase [Streptomyces ipomoeae]|uniref:SDR family NAD(P)-dependent oxidoreductase n=1 Tax=Streptomyces ipomoeae TaxID=103232 RepID=UPI001146D8FE|nr:SDR family NAD(P)-dependent oxidoreductase [Streptomyces ipomoeae]MDX2938367.1 SDR family NAD(P)-dependent oxidoreductase [Streptomyces ipomoeae]TQE22070.1 SDR family oxidoreductase [Streptomyces ipomoeae]